MLWETVPIYNIVNYKNEIILDFILATLLLLIVSNCENVDSSNRSSSST